MWATPPGRLPTPPRPRGQHRGSGSLDSTSCHLAWIERQRGDRGSQDTCKTWFLPRRPPPLPAPLPLVCSGRFQWEWVGEGAGREKTRPRLPQRSHSKQGGCASPGKPAGLRLRPRPSSGYFPGQVQATSPLRGQVQTAVGKPATCVPKISPLRAPALPSRAGICSRIKVNFSSASRQLCSLPRESCLWPHRAHSALSRGGPEPPNRALLPAGVSRVQAMLLQPLVALQSSGSRQSPCRGVGWRGPLQTLSSPRLGHQGTSDSWCRVWPELCWRWAGGLCSPLSA